jgi:translocation and assembly module TamB
VSYTFDADLLITGTATRPEIHGEVRLEELLYARRLNWKTMIFETLERRPKQVKRKAEYGSIFLDLTARGTENLRVQNNLAELELAFELRARGFLPNPVLWGRVEVIDGTARFRGQEYELLRSSAEFLGEAQPVPQLDVHARTQTRQHAVTVNVTGPLDDVQVTTSSIPPLSQTDTLALLVYGSTADEMGGGGGVSAAEGASFLTGKLQDQLETGVGTYLGIDEFQIDPAYSPSAQTTVPRVTVGKTVTKNLRARYSAAISGETEQDLEVQYKWNPHVSVLGSWSDKGSESKGSVGGEVRVRFTFR